MCVCVNKKHAYYLEIGGGGGGGRLCLPVEVTEVGGLGHQSLLPLEVRLEVFRLEAMGVVDVPAHLRTYGVREHTGGVTGGERG